MVDGEGAATAIGRRFTTQRRIRFGQCDPAGIVFFPRYLEMCNDVIEDWCRDALGFDFAEIHTGKGWGLPTVHLTVDYSVPSSIGDVLTVTLGVRRLGRTSMRLHIVFLGAGGEERVRVEQVVVLTEPHTHRPVPIPDILRSRIAAFHVLD